MTPVALVTRARVGIGRVTAIALASSGMRVAVTSRSGMGPSAVIRWLVTDPGSDSHLGGYLSAQKVAAEMGLG